MDTVKKTISLVEPDEAELRKRRHSATTHSKKKDDQEETSTTNTSHATSSSTNTSPASVHTPAKDEKKLQVADMRGSHNIHRSSRVSLLSAEQKDVDLRGFFNLAGIVLLVLNARLVIENLLKYGLLIELPSAKHIQQWPQTWPALTCTLALPGFALFAHLVEVAAFNHYLSTTSAFLLHAINIFTVFSLPVLIIHFSNATILSAMIVLFVSVVMVLKLVSYVHTSYDVRIIKQDKNALKALPTSQPSIDSCLIECDYETLNNYSPSLSHLFYFLAAPTLCYQLSYPRSPRIRRRFALRRLLECLFCLALMGFIIEQYIMPTVRNSVKFMDNMEFVHLFERLLKLAVPNLIVWLLMFYCLFHSFLNLTAELLRFNDRLFYRAWWNSLSLDEFWRTWNIPVHSHLLRHVYAPLVRSGFSSTTAMFVVFLYSAFLHEWLISVPMKQLSFHAFFAMLFQVPLILVTKAVNSYVQNATFSNILFWLIFVIFGQPSIVFLYYYSYVKATPAA